MKWILVLGILGLSVSVDASSIVNPAAASTPGGVSGNVQYNNGGSFGGASFLNVYASSGTSSADFLWTTNSVGPTMIDANNCVWRETVDTSGNLLTTKLTCPVVAQVRGCGKGVPIGILLALTCSGPDSQ